MVANRTEHVKPTCPRCSARKPPTRYLARMGEAGQVGFFNPLEESIVEILCFLFAWCVICGGLGYAVGAQKGQGGLGAVLGCLLGPIGILIAVLLPKA
jgi:hypothetical protein